ncbi:hypothetical protein FQN54_003723 [Arachnomyces sp. PD_36]|nr:hypothetical protein FQN54_003723 [Arachnomyces sp. PD_36]
MGNSTSSVVHDCLVNAVGGNEDLLAFSNNPLYQISDVHPYNLDIPLTPAAVTYPETAEHVAGIVKCAAEADLKVQARSGGHSYANYCLGGVDGAITVDMKNFQQFSMDESTWVATIGAGTLLKDVASQLHDAGGRAIAHGISPPIGMGGHATIGGLGPASRMWGSALDHVLEAEVVLANSSIVRASETENPDLFFALKGAGAGFGIITEFKCRTEAEPGEAVRYSYSVSFGEHAPMAGLFKDWQAFISKPELTRKFATSLIVAPLSMIISGTYFGTEEEYNALGFDEIFGDNSNSSVVLFDDWLGLVGNWAEDIFLEIGSSIPAPFYSKSLAIDTPNLMSNDTIDALFENFDADPGTPAWFTIFDLTGGAINEVPLDATSYPHRDTLYFMQAYGVGIGGVSDTTRDFITGLADTVTSGNPDADFRSYAGYVDPALENGQKSYWGSNLPRLEQIKRAVDPNDVFQNPQSVRPAADS